jgi:cytochrome c oxidase subunit 3
VEDPAEVAEAPAEEAVDAAAAEPVPTPDPERSALPPAAEGPHGLAAPEAEEETGEIEVEPKNAQTFFSIYFLMTGLHGIHVLGGIGAFVWLLMCTRRGDFDTGNFTKVDIVALYWHLVDLIWIYLFLLLYLID